MAIKFISLEELQKVAHERGFLLCPKCAQKYEPAAAVSLEWTEQGIAHIIPVMYDPQANYDALGRKFVDHYYDGQKRNGWGGVYRVAHNTLYNGNFVRQLVQHYPALQNGPITERALHEAGCNLEDEIALWQLGNYTT
jgi:hypothetical protein